MRLFAVSRDSPYSHRRYAEQQWLTYPLLSDWSGEAVAAFDVSQTLDGLGNARPQLLPRRRRRVIRGAWRYADDDVPDLDVLLDAAHGLGG